MKTDSQQRTSPPIEYWLVLGIALRASGLTYHILFIVVLYFLFKHWQPLAGFALLTLTSIFVGLAFSTFYSLLISHPETFNMTRFLEPVIVTFMAVALLFTRKRGLAWALIVYSTLSCIVYFLCSVYHFPRAASPRALFVVAIFSFVQLWLLSTWMRSQPQIATLQDTTTHEKDIPSA